MIFQNAIPALARTCAKRNRNDELNCAVIATTSTTQLSYSSMFKLSHLYMLKVKAASTCTDCTDISPLVARGSL